MLSAEYTSSGQLCIKALHIQRCRVYVRFRTKSLIHLPYLKTTKIMNKFLAPIPETLATEYAENWRTFIANNSVDGTELDQFMARAFTFSLQDVSDLMEEQGVHKVRVYFGFTGNPPTAGSPLPMKVMLVGVNEDGQDMIYPGEPVSGIYDFATPCPPTCDAASPLAG